MAKFLFIAFFVFLNEQAIAQTVEANARRLDVGRDNSFPMYLYEVCGKATAEDKSQVQFKDVLITADLGSRNEASYMTKTDSKGEFCHILRILGRKFGVSLVN